MLKIELLDWQAAQREAKRIRFKVFVEEQGVPRELEMDENDAQSLHALAYADGLVPLIVPITLINHYVARFDTGSVRDQIYLHPHPKELMLRNHV